ncbi:hypothetical protein Cadr_000018396 [Camelus dromedarius]|uniref:Uncharacterized protein n=1 Tax=Camelus dromedarius TaxID=9838 RepID=A0A5N4D897_CAMDR|nr:hypothetical protein Cadr_000018396 [Camelus dromedarius]
MSNAHPALSPHMGHSLQQPQRGGREEDQHPLSDPCIGKSVSQELAHCGVHMILACRSHERGQQALAEIRAASKSNQLLLGLPTTRTPEGLDVTFATNYIGPFLLTNLLQGKEGWVLIFCAAPVSSFLWHFRGLPRPVVPRCLLNDAPVHFCWTQQGNPLGRSLD